MTSDIRKVGEEGYSHIGLHPKPIDINGLWNLSISFTMDFGLRPMYVCNVSEYYHIFLSAQRSCDDERILIEQNVLNYHSLLAKTNPVM